LARPQKKAADEGVTLVFVDESGFYLLPGRVVTYAPRAQTPVLHWPISRDHLSVMSALTATGRLLTRVRPSAFTSADSVAFLKHLQHQIDGKICVIWDGAPIHSGAVRTFLASGGAKRIHLERLPAYAPDLNPDEGVWQQLKHVEMRNLCCADLADLRRQLRLATMRLQNKPHLLRACFAGAALPLGP
jgi:transposase